MATNWKIESIGSFEVTGKWEDKSDAIEDIWEDSSIEFYFSAGTSWTVTSKGIARDSD